MSFSGKRILALESRRAKETTELIRRHGGDPFVAPSMREVPLEENHEAYQFAERLFRGEFDMAILQTGVGTRFLDKVIEARYGPGKLAEALRTVTIVARGPKPSAVLREMNVPIHVAVPEPNTWREILDSIKDRPERRIAVQEYGKPSEHLLAGLRARGADVTPVPVYQWTLPQDLAPLQEAVRRLSANRFDMVLFMSSVQVDHLLQVASDMGLSEQVMSGLHAAQIVSIGPSTTETLTEHGVRVDLEPTHPKFGVMVKEAAELSARVSHS